METLNPDQQQVYSYVKERFEKNITFRVLLQGVAGTGKSYLLDKIVSLASSLKKKPIVGSHQAIAASLINGITLYKIFGFNGPRTSATVLINGFQHQIKKEGEEYKEVRRMKSNIFNDGRNFYSNPIDNLLIIDEISMVGIEFLDDMDQILQIVFKNTLPFGGINLFFTGDFAQLTPVNETSIFKIKQDHFVKHMKYFSLTINQRQADQTFFDLCQGVRKAALKSSQKQLLKSRLVSNFPDLDLQDLVHLLPTKVLCDQHNTKRLLEMNEMDYYFVRSVDSGDPRAISPKEQKSFNGLSNYLIFTVKSKIMITVNQEPFINGEVFKIEKVEVDHTITQDKFFENLDRTDSNLLSSIINQLTQMKKNIHFSQPGGITIFVNHENKLLDNDDKKTSTDQPSEVALTPIPPSSKSIRAVLLNSKGEPQSQDIFSRVMHPFQLAWAVTTHKIQGITLNEGVIDMGGKNFDPSQLYVNISRLKSLDNLYIRELKLPLPPSPNKILITNFLKEVKENNKREEEEEEEVNQDLSVDDFTCL